MKTNIFRIVAIIALLAFQTMILSETTASSILEKGNSGNNGEENIKKLAQVSGEKLPAAPAKERTSHQSMGTQKVELDSVSSFDPPRVPSAVMRQRHFTIPFALTPSQNTGPFSVELLSSDDRGKTWISSGRIECPSSQNEFFFRAGHDGEYWFILRTIFPGGNRKTSPVQAILVKTGESVTRDRSGSTSLPGATAAQTGDAFKAKAEKSGANAVKSESTKNTIATTNSLAKTSPVPQLAQFGNKANEKNASVSSQTGKTSSSKKGETEVSNTTSLAEKVVASGKSNVKPVPPVQTKGQSDFLASPVLSFPVKGGEGTADSLANREERARKLLELASEGPVSKSGNKGSSSSAGAAVDSFSVSKLESGPTGAEKTQGAPSSTIGSSPSAISMAPLGSSAKKTETKSTPLASDKRGTVEKKESSNQTSAAGSTAVEKPAEIALPGQIKSISIGKTQWGEPTIMVRWFRPEDVGLPTGTKGSLRIERSENASGPWMTIVSDLQKDHPGYWWKATQFDTVPFYLRVVVTDENGNESSDVVKQKLELASRLQVVSPEPHAAAPVPKASETTAKPKETSQVAKTGAKTTEKRFLSRLFKKETKEEARDVPPTPQESLARSNLKEQSSSQNRKETVTGVPAATYNSASSAPTVNEPSPVFQITNADQTKQGPWKEASLQREIENTPQNTQEGRKSVQSAAPSPGVRTAKTSQPPRRNYDPGELNWNPIFTEGFGAMFQGFRSQDDRVQMQNVQGGNVETPAAPKKRSIFTPPERYNALPRQEETGYNNVSGVYSNGSGAVAGQGIGVMSDMSGTFAGGMVANQVGMSGDSGVIPGGTIMNGVDGQGQMTVPGAGVNSSEIIYLDQYGNRIANPFASGAMNSWSGNTGTPGNVSGVPGGPVEGGQYMLDPSGNLIPYSPSGMPGYPVQQSSPFSTSGSGTFVPGANSSSAAGGSNVPGTTGTGGIPGTGMTMPGPN